MLQILSKKDKLTARLVQDQYYPPYKLQNDVVEFDPCYTLFLPAYRTSFIKQNAQKRVCQELQ